MPTNGKWFELNIDEGAAQDGLAVGEVVVVERARGDCCGCCGPIRPDPRYGGGSGTDLGVGRFVGGVVAFIGGIVSATLLAVVVWSLDSYEPSGVVAAEVASGDLGSGF